MSLDPQILTLIDLALAEDVGAGDVTSLACLPADARCQAHIRAKQTLVVSGLKVAAAAFARVGSTLHVEMLSCDGAHVAAGTELMRIAGNTRSILSAERTALNFLQQLSGIATLTHEYVQRIAHTKTKLLDTRKTLPGYRTLARAAVRAGGGTNHRLGLFDRYLIKNNHITAAGSIAAAVARAKEQNAKGLLIEVETRTAEEVHEALAAGADIIMVDNMSPSEVRDAVQLISGKAKSEASGNITLQNIAAYAETGVDFISVGAITHSAPAADIHLIISS